MNRLLLGLLLGLTLSWNAAAFEARRMLMAATSENAAYTAQSVKFDGTNDYLRRAGAFTGGATSGKQGIISIWVNLKGGDAALQIAISQDAGYGQLERTAANRWRLFIWDVAGSAISLDISSNNTFTSASGWTHILAAWNVATGTAQLYINDASDVLGSPTALNNTLEYNRFPFSVAANQAGGTKLNADVADIYFNTDTTLDMSVTANRRKFISALGKPVDLGVNCSTPTGAAPQICLTNAFGTFQVNNSGYGDYVVTGTLAPGTDSPSD